MSSTTPSFAPPDPLAGKRGMAMMGAYVLADGTLQYGSGAVSATRDGTGIYRVTFDRDITGCFTTATANYSRTLAVVGVPSANQQGVATLRDDGTPTDAAFFVTMFCAK